MQGVQYLRGEPPPGPVLLHGAARGSLSLLPGVPARPHHTDADIYAERSASSNSFHLIIERGDHLPSGAPFFHQMQTSFVTRPCERTLGLIPVFCYYPKPVVSKLFLSFQMLPRHVDENKLLEVLLTGQGVCAF